jgi:hypothetical protein
LKKGGRCFCTAYLISEEARSHLIDGSSVRKFYAHSMYWAESAESPESSIAYPESYIRALFSRVGLPLARVVPGEWWHHLSAQDIFVAYKS